MQFEPGSIDGVIWKPLRKHADGRGWLCELFRFDDIPEEFRPVMAYISLSEVDVARGPHEHSDQADFFCFIGPSDFKVYLWDNRPESTTYRRYETRIVGQSEPAALIVPPRVVHAYRNVGGQPGIVFNRPNRLYKGWDRREPVDEIRHELQTASPFKLD
jgi:dTDP-4-dehydrorhamnose 3,5-epimerase